jgi:hypothetical protein
MIDFEDLDPLAESDGMSIGADPADGLIEAAEESICANAYLMDIASQDEICDIAESYDEMDNISELMGMAMETSIVRLDRKSRLKHLRKANVLNLARKSNNAKYKKLLTIWKMERSLESDLDRIYRNKATQLAKHQIKNYAANGVKRIPKAYPETVVGKGKPSTAVAQRAKHQADKMFGSKRTSVDSRK